jgi:2-polyprenyl-3-methyl-5-hydroxy-6-metoxy-1,4-benzoquinol methylase
MRTSTSQMRFSGALAESMLGDATSGDPNGPGSAEARIIAANRDFYRQIAKKYDRYENCASNAYLQRILEKDLDKIHSSFMALEEAPRCLDCGGGTGNLALKMLARGWDVTVVDVSDDMLDVLREKVKAKRFLPKLISTPIEQFLTATSVTFDLVAFSSVLHHLYSYARIAELAAKKVRVGGFFYSNCDPVIPKWPAWTWAFDSLDIAIAKLMLDPKDVLPGIGRRLRKMILPRDPSLGRRVVSAGDVAEYHVRAGVDDEEIVRTLQDSGFGIVEHLRYSTGRTKVLRFLNQRLRLLESFKIIARRNSGPV